MSRAFTRNAWEDIGGGKGEGNLAKLLRRKRCFSGFECTLFLSFSHLKWFCIVTIMEFSCRRVISSKECNQFGINFNFWYKFIYLGILLKHYISNIFFNLKFCLELFKGTKIHWNFEYWFYFLKRHLLIYLCKKLRRWFYFCFCNYEEKRVLVKQRKYCTVICIYRSLSLHLNLIRI